MTGPSGRYETEWVLLTSGTTGVPKLVVHTLASLAGAIDIGKPGNERVIWSTFLRYSPIWRFADISARHADRKLPAVVE